MFSLQHLRNNQTACFDIIDVLFCILHNEDCTPSTDPKPLLQILQCENVKRELAEAEKTLVSQYCAIWCEHDAIFVAFFIFVKRRKPIDEVRVLDRLLKWLNSSNRCSWDCGTVCSRHASEAHVLHALAWIHKERMHWWHGKLAGKIEHRVHRLR